MPYYPTPAPTMWPTFSPSDIPDIDVTKLLIYAGIGVGCLIALSFVFWCILRPMCCPTASCGICSDLFGDVCGDEVCDLLCLCEGLSEPKAKKEEHITKVYIQAPVPQQTAPEIPTRMARRQQSSQCAQPVLIHNPSIQIPVLEQIPADMTTQSNQVRVEVQSE